MAPLVQYQHSTLVCFGILSTIPQVLGLSDEAKIGITSLVLVAFIGGATIAISILLLWLNVVQAKGVTGLLRSSRPWDMRLTEQIWRMKNEQTLPAQPHLFHVIGCILRKQDYYLVSLSPSKIHGPEANHRHSA